MKRYTKAVVIKNRIIAVTVCLLMLVTTLSPVTAYAKEDDTKTIKVGYFEFPGYHEIYEDTQGAHGSGYGFDFLQLLRRYTKEIPKMKDDLKGIRVLMAEDNDLNAEIAEIQLEDMGMKVTRANDGQEVVNIFKDNPPKAFDIILMDVMMPYMNGYEATKTIRTLKERPDGAAIPIIAMTANAFAEDVQASIDAGMDGHLSKPIVIEEVARTIIHNL